ncbi:hypothetical protein CMO93_04635 [Candidatus Woesearchaeota archaeon]|nr:hypothetical protein [Candidatus Woesearchaeota archaeon]|tara:strand:- start:1650 stop:2870 length:1221 start_codon:yes stop_codon:yes gene_type:complete
MSKCLVCHEDSVSKLLDFGKNPVCNDFTESEGQENKKFPLILGFCEKCGLAQLINPFPQEELKPKYSWISYNEPESHLDKVADNISPLPNISKDSKILGISYKDDTLLQRMKKLGYSNIKRLDLQKDLGDNDGYGDIETIQKLMNQKTAEEILKKYGKFDVIFSRHILEHTYDIHGFVSSLKILLNENGYIIFEIPDYTKPFQYKDYSSIWEEHIIYFTPQTFKNSFPFLGLELKKFDAYSYPLENSLVAIVKISKQEKKLPDNNILKEEKDRILSFTQSFATIKDKTNSYLSELSKKGEKIAVFGAGHNACFLVNVFGIAKYLNCFVDDNINKRGMYMPGSKLEIRGLSILSEGDIHLCIFSLNPEIEEKIISKNDNLKGSVDFLSFCPKSQRSIYDQLKVKNET